jgi:hypothetical protein
MLKKAGNITIILLLLVATGGLPVTRHYCGATQMSFSVFSTPKACCEGSCDKCHNVFKFSKVNDNFEAGSSVSTQALADFVNLHTAFFIDLFDNVAITTPDDGLYHRAVCISLAGLSPASLGNFRC